MEEEKPKCHDRKYQENNQDRILIKKAAEHKEQHRDYHKKQNPVHYRGAYAFP
tara:strand:- start:2801 stop:2959 length:159 start_codon:yes stop_codon:yes gene_type:complete